MSPPRWMKPRSTPPHRRPISETVLNHRGSQIAPIVLVRRSRYLVLWFKNTNHIRPLVKGVRVDLLRTISTPHPPPWAGIEPNQLNQPNEASTVTPTCCCYPVGVGSSVPFRSVPSWRRTAQGGGAQYKLQTTTTNLKNWISLSLSPPFHSIRPTTAT